jgi:hypothetical protein
LLLGCRPGDAPPRAATPAATVETPPAADPLPTDTAATIAAYEARVARIEQDTVAMTQTQKPIALGAGSSGLLSAWRAGPVWRRLRVEAEGAGFRTRDDYWFGDGVLLGARLEVSRPGRRPAVDRVWFRNQALYRWTDAAGRHLNPEARSTQFEVRMMRARLDTLLQRLNADDAIRSTR